LKKIFEPEEAAMALHLRAGGLQPRVLGRPSIPPSFAERHWMPSGESIPPGIPHPSPSPPCNPGEGKLGVGKKIPLSAGQKPEVAVALGFLPSAHTDNF